MKGQKYGALLFNDVVIEALFAWWRLTKSSLLWSDPTSCLISDQLVVDGQPAYMWATNGSQRARGAKWPQLPPLMIRTTNFFRSKSKYTSCTKQQLMVASTTLHNYLDQLHIFWWPVCIFQEPMVTTEMVARQIPSYYREQPKPMGIEASVRTQPSWPSIEGPVKVTITECSTTFQGQDCNTSSIPDPHNWLAPLKSPCEQFKLQTKVERGWKHKQHAKVWRVLLQ